MSDNKEDEPIAHPVSMFRACPFCGSTDRTVKFFEPPFQILQCSKCSLVYLGNPPEQGAIYERYYESNPPDPLQYHARSDDPLLAELCAINEQRVSCLKEFKTTGRLLDIGCGRGMFLKTARDRGFAVRGIDISEGAVAYAKTAFGLDAEVFSIDDVKEAGNTFDVITLWHVLEHFLDPVKELQKVKDLLNTNGICLVEVPNLRSLKFLTARQKWRGGDHPLYHRTFFTADTLQATLRKAGFPQVKRLRLSYRIPGRNPAYELLKATLNLFSADAFLVFIAWK